MPIDKGWFKLPGIRADGDRTIDEQSDGLDHALEEASGKTVLDLGCAEGAISLLFAQAGAVSVLGIELLESHLEIARRYCKDAPQIKFKCAHLMNHIEENPKPKRYDIVLALSILHKIKDPVIGVRFAARSCRDLLLFRAPSTMRDGFMRSKFSSNTCEVGATLRGEGFKEEREIHNKRKEPLQYWRRVK